MSDDFDELTSAYLDGQATPDEAARVEADPELLGEVESMRALADRLVDEVPPVDGDIRAHQMAAGMAAFADLFGSRAEGAVGHGVDDLTRRRQTRATRNGLPSWLSAAAALLLVVGGIGWIARQSGSDDSDAESLDSEIAIQADGDDSATESDDEAEEAAATTDSAGDSADDSAGESDAFEAQAEEAAAADEDTAAGAPASTTTAAGGFFPAEKVAEARVEFEFAPDTGQLAALAEGPLLDTELSRCGFEIESPAGGELVGFVPISVAGADQEVLVYATAGAGAEQFTPLVVDGECAVLP